MDVESRSDTLTLWVYALTLMIVSVAFECELSKSNVFVSWCAQSACVSLCQIALQWWLAYVLLLLLLRRSINSWLIQKLLLKIVFWGWLRRVLRHLRLNESRWLVMMIAIIVSNRGACCEELWLFAWNVLLRFGLVCKTLDGWSSTTSLRPTE